MPDSICCGVHENLYCAIICIILIGSGDVFASLFTFYHSLNRCDLAACVIWFLLLAALGGRLLLLNAAFSKDLYDETQAYGELIQQEEPSLVSAFPVVEEIVDPERNLWRMDLKTISVKIVCSAAVTESQCREIANFIRSRIRSMGGMPFADLDLSFWSPSPDTGKGRLLFAETITVREQKAIQDFRSWVAKAFPVHPWLGTAALFLLAVLTGTAVTGFEQERGGAQEGRRGRIIFRGLFCAAAVSVFGGFYLLNGFFADLLYCHMLTLLVLPYALVAAGCWSVRFYFRRERSFFRPFLLTLFFISAAMIAGGVLLSVDLAGSSLL